MAQRRVRPAVERSGGLNIRLPDGTTMSMPIHAATGRTSDVCCFCGQGIEHTDSERIGIDARWEEGGNERQQSWGAHRKCLRERMHEAVMGEGPFFGDD
jgi:hypothetical protein